MTIHILYDVNPFTTKSEVLNSNQKSNAVVNVHFNPFPNNKSFDPSKLKEFADNNFNFNENGRKFSKRLQNTLEKGEIAPNENAEKASLSDTLRLMLLKEDTWTKIKQGKINFISSSLSQTLQF